MKFCSMLAICATYVPLEISQGTQRLATIVQDAQLVAILTQDDTLPLVAEVGWNKPDFVINLSRLSISSSIRVPDLHNQSTKTKPWSCTQAGPPTFLRYVTESGVSRSRQLLERTQMWNLQNLRFIS